MMRRTCESIKTLLSALLPMTVLLAPVAQAASVQGGSLTLNLDRDALIAAVHLDNYPDVPTETYPICCRPSIYAEEFFDASAASLTFPQLLAANPPDLNDASSDEIPAVELRYAVNGSTLPRNPLGRANRTTTFRFDEHDLFGSAEGRIGLNGVLRFRVDVEPPTNRVLVGDMTLIYDRARDDLIPGQSPWTLMNNINLVTVAYNLFDVQTALTGDLLTVDGVLGLGDGFDHLNGTRNARVGTFHFETTVVPIPAAVWLFSAGLLGVTARSGAWRARRGGQQC